MFRARCKSTLIIDTLYRHLAREFNDSSLEPAPFKKISGTEHLDKIIEINQKPIGRTPRSVPATYVGLFPMIRDLYAALPEAKLRGYKPGHFSFKRERGTLRKPVAVAVKFVLRCTF